MKTLIVIAAMGMLILPTAVLAGKGGGSSAGKGQPKVPVCHFGIDEDLLVETMNIIVISNKAVAKHLAKHSNSLGADYVVADEICENGLDEDCDGLDAVCP